jgi:hypothetical protein
MGDEDPPPRTSSLAIDSSGRIPLVNGGAESLSTITGLGSVTQELEVRGLHRISLACAEQAQHTELYLLE